MQLILNAMTGYKLRPIGVISLEDPDVTTRLKSYGVSVLTLDLSSLKVIPMLTSWKDIAIHLQAKFNVNICIRTIQNWHKTKPIPFAKSNHKLYICPDKLDRWYRGRLKTR